ncbi:hypothetical protein FSP39_014664 [Pinctada imbricata]|uniref:Programmed cell death protein 7 n=1 Tax=Pinctada imbricata TaxID=66713 RepID=A0AA89BXE8_PINIB|nr:hypothetical protein FSP39_014664 [Pinctada imbricata]
MDSRPRVPFRPPFNTMNQTRASHINQTQKYHSSNIQSFPNQAQLQAPPNRQWRPPTGVPDESLQVFNTNSHGGPRFPMKQHEGFAFRDSSNAMFQHPPPNFLPNVTNRLNVPPPNNRFTMEVHPHQLPPMQQNQKQQVGMLQPAPHQTQNDIHENQGNQYASSYQQNTTTCRFPMPQPPPPQMSAQNSNQLNSNYIYRKETSRKFPEKVSHVGLNENDDREPHFNSEGNVMQYKKGQKQHYTQDPTRNDITWIDNWLNEIGKNKNDIVKDTKSSPEITSIGDADGKIRSMMLLMARLQQQTKNLRTMVTDSEVEWEGQVKEVLEMKNQLKVMKNSIQDAETISKLKRKLSMRRKKRERIKRKRKEDHEEKKAIIEHREELHKTLDNWQEQRRLEVEQKKQEVEMKKSADEILNEVRKKILDTTKLTDLHKGLQKLRKLRKDRMKQQGVFTNPVSDEKFDVVLQEQYVVLDKRKDTYLAEEKALKVMLETEQEDNKEKEREKALLIQRQKQEKQEKKDKEMLFGKPDFHGEEDGLYPFYQFYDQANHSFDSFVQIRRDWDSFIVPPSVPGGSRLPDGWVLPPEPSSPIWASALKDA